eukprot:5599351-Alexandrium_andersonii.AAC.1
MWPPTTPCACYALTPRSEASRLSVPSKSIDELFKRSRAAAQQCLKSRRPDASQQCPCGTGICIMPQGIGMKEQVQRKSTKLQCVYVAWVAYASTRCVPRSPMSGADVVVCCTCVSSCRMRACLQGVARAPVATGTHP